MSNAKKYLYALDSSLMTLDAHLIPNPSLIRQAVQSARDCIAVCIQEIEELKAAVIVKNDLEKGGKHG